MASFRSLLIGIPKWNVDHRIQHIRLYLVCKFDSIKLIRWFYIELNSSGNFWKFWRQFRRRADPNGGLDSLLLIFVKEPIGINSREWRVQPSDGGAALLVADWLPLNWVCRHTPSHVALIKRPRRVARDKTTISRSTHQKANHRRSQRHLSMSRTKMAVAAQQNVWLGTLFRTLLIGISQCDVDQRIQHI